MAAGLFALCSADAAVLACFDANGQNGPTNAGFEGFNSTTATQNGITLTLSSGPTSDSRNRGDSNAPIDGRPDEAMLQDFFALATGTTFTLSGLSANQSYDVTIYSYDPQFSGGGAANWYENSIDPGNLLATVDGTTGNPDGAQFTASLTASATGEIVIVTEDLPGNPSRVFFNGLEIVPEPSSSALAASGLLLLLGQRRRK